MHWFLKCAAAVVVGAVVISRLNSDQNMADTAATTPMEYLSAITLQSVDGDEKVMASDLWKDHGAVIMAVRRPG